MPSLISIIPAHQAKILSAILKIDGLVRSSVLSEADANLASSITAYLVQLRNLISTTQTTDEEKRQDPTEVADQILIDEDQFNAIRQTLHKQLSEVTKISPLSQQL